MKAIVDQNVCVGCGLCAGTSPDSFRMNDGGRAEFFAESDDALIQEAVDVCPVAAIAREE